MAMQAQDTLHADMPDGTQMVINRGEILPDDHLLVKRDREAQAAADKEKRERVPQFKPFSLGETAPKARAARGVGKTGKA
jgi:hypothetical protein